MMTTLKDINYKFAFKIKLDQIILLNNILQDSIRLKLSINNT